MIICAACNQPIFERYLSQVLDKAWHNSCVKCSICNILLKDKCFTRDGRLFCRDDFMRIFGQKCTGCNQTIAANDLIRKARGKIFHINCFCCTYCQKRMDTGEELYIVGGCKFLCKKDFMNGQYQLIAKSKKNYVISKSANNLLLIRTLGMDEKSFQSRSACKIAAGEIRLLINEYANGIVF
uniref:LIM zinc-binding domain-containing protein n=1 Tax=Romanomermis culicivorax TaxID=13658 RepID=A0A915IC28_ROMCU